MRLSTKPSSAVTTQLEANCKWDSFCGRMHGASHTGWAGVLMAEGSQLSPGTARQQCAVFFHQREVAWGTGEEMSAACKWSAEVGHRPLQRLAGTNNSLVIYATDTVLRVF